jgi:hypothetical protein
MEFHGSSADNSLEWGRTAILGLLWITNLRTEHTAVDLVYLSRITGPFPVLSAVESLHISPLITLFWLDTSEAFLEVGPNYLKYRPPA